MSFQYLILDFYHSVLLTWVETNCKAFCGSLNGVKFNPVSAIGRFSGFFRGTAADLFLSVDRDSDGCTAVVVGFTSAIGLLNKKKK